MIGHEPPRGTAINWSLPITRNLNMLFALNEGGGGRIFNAAQPRRGLIGTFNNGMSWAPGNVRLGHSLYGDDGRDQNVEIASGDWDLDTSQPHTLLVWFFNPETGWQKGILRGSYQHLYLSFNAGIDSIEYRTNSTDNDSDANAIGVGWHQIVVTSSGSAINFYSNGVPVGSTANGHSHGDAALHLGYTTSGLRESNIGQLAAWQRVLSASEIEWLNRDPWWMFDIPRRFAVRQLQHARVLK